MEPQRVGLVRVGVQPPFLKLRHIVHDL
jgi:hypothetical protein